MEVLTLGVELGHVIGTWWVEARAGTGHSKVQEMLLPEASIVLRLSPPNLEAAKLYGKQTDPLSVCVLLVVKSEKSGGRENTQGSTNL